MPPRSAAATAEMPGYGELAPEHLRCRTWGHPWDNFTPIDMGQPPYGWRESVRCTRCTTERHRLIDRKGAVMSVKYYYPEGYLLTKGTGRLDRADLRSTLFEQLRIRLDESNAIAAGFDASNGKVVPIKQSKAKATPRKGT